MGCSRPYKAFFTGCYTETGKKDYLLCLTTSGNMVSVGYAEKRHKRIGAAAPVRTINGKTYLVDPIAVPCGHCSGCRMDRANEWRNRLVLESLDYPGKSWFVTLTYDEAHLPVSKDGELYLNKRDLQLFMKRLRANTGRKFRFLACGEYGSANGRPHFHLILFGDLLGFERTGINRFHVADIAKAWTYGLHEVSLAEPGTMAYVAGYCNKKVNDPDWDSYLVKPFLLMSRKPAIGDNYRQRKDLEKQGFHIFGDFGGKHYANLPRIFVRKSENELWYANYRARMEKAAREALPHDIARFGVHAEEEIGDLKELFINSALEKKERPL